jgi:hypothetical protein
MVFIRLTIEPKRLNPVQLNTQSPSERAGMATARRSHGRSIAPDLPLSRARLRPFGQSPLPVFSEICPQAASSFVRIQNMNTDYGFFHLFKALQSLRYTKTQSAFPESRSEVEVTLPKIKYSLLGSQSVQQRRCQQRALRWQQFELMNAAAAGRQPIHL